MKTPSRRRSLPIEHEFVDFIPDKLSQGIIYVSIEYATAVHSCFCGCGERVVTPISPTGWKFIFDGDTVSFYPSVGNWGFRCRSHYWITGSHVIWAANMSTAEIERGRKRDRGITDAYYGVPGTTESHKQTAHKPKGKRGFVNWLIGK